MSVRISRHCYHYGFWFSRGRWALYAPYIRLNAGYFV